MLIGNNLIPSANPRTKNLRAPNKCQQIEKVQIHKREKEIEVEIHLDQKQIGIRKL